MRSKADETLVTVETLICPLHISNDFYFVNTILHFINELFAMQYKTIKHNTPTAFFESEVHSTKLHWQVPI